MTDWDFGFTDVENEKQTIRKDAQKTTEKMLEMIMPLLLKLSDEKNDKDYIHWPFATRKKQIEKFIEDLTKTSKE